MGQRQDLIISIPIYLKYKYTNKNAGFCIFCIDDFKILKICNNRNFRRFFIEKRHRRQPPLPQRPYDVSRGQNRYATLPYHVLCFAKPSILISVSPTQRLSYRENKSERASARFLTQYGVKTGE